MVKMLAENQSGTHELKDLVALVEARDRVGVRMALIGQEDHWLLVHGQMLLDGDPVTERTWRYPRVAFLERQMTGPDAAALLRKEPAEFPEVGPVMPAEPVLQVEFQRCASFKTWMGLRWPWPQTSWTVGLVGHDPALPQELLVGTGPPFPSFVDALASFFFARPHDSAAGRPPRWLVQRIDRTAHLTEVTISATDLALVVTGDRAAEIRVEFSTPTEHRIQHPDETGRVVFPLADGLKPSTTLIVRDGGTWTDWRYFHDPSVRESDPSVRWVRPGAELTDLIEAGEGPQVEFKREVPKGGSEPARKALKTVAAFASQDGGFILFGVDDEATIVGISDQSPVDRQEVALTGMIENGFYPVPDFTLTHPQLEGKTVIVLQVHPGGRRYPLDPRKPIHYKRVGASTMPVRQAELEARTY